MNRSKTIDAVKAPHTKVAMVVQRYGTEVVGGAESLAREVAEKWVSALGWQVDVFTTTAKSYLSWANEYEKGETLDKGVRIYRFDSKYRRSPLFGIYHRFISPMITVMGRRKFLKLFAMGLEWLWIRLQGPFCPDLLEALKDKAPRYEKIFFVTYLYYPTIEGLKVAPEKSILIPTAHDERPFYFKSIQKSIASVSRYIVLTSAEKRLLEMSTALRKDAVFFLGGLGFDGDQIPFSPPCAVGAQAERYILYLGRISPGKGVHDLLRFMDAYKKHTGDDQLKIILAGKIEDMALPRSPDVVFKGFVSDAQKRQLVRDAAVLINPSAHESLSIVVLEAMASGTPVIVNGLCEVLADYAKQTPTVFSYRNEIEFVDVLRNTLEKNWASAESHKRAREVAKLGAFNLLVERGISTI